MSQPLWRHPWAIPVGRSTHWSLGPLSLWISHSKGQWLVASRSTRGVETEEWSVEEGESAASPPSIDHVLKRVPTSREGPVVLVPRHADRPVVARPETPVVLPPKESIRAFVHAAAWVQVCVGEPIAEIPAVRPSDTWFGTTREGTLCYAMRTSLRLESDPLPPRPYRIRAPVRIRNEGTDPLELARLRLPVPQLSVFCDADGRLWSEEVVMTRSGGQEEAEVRVTPGAPEGAEGAQRVSEPRQAPESNPIVRVFNSVFS